MAGSTLASAKWTLASAKQKLNTEQLASELRAHAMVIQTSTACALFGLAVELSLKLLIECTTGNCARRTHNLTLLFGDLPPEEQEFLRSTIDNCEQFLDTHKSSFEDWRYFHDADPKNDREMVDPELAEQLVLAIAQRRTDGATQ